MDAKRIVFGEDAIDDLEKIETYIATQSPDAASRVIRSIRARISQLEDFPNIGVRERRGFGRLLIETRYRHKIVYDIEGDVVQVHRVLGPRQSTPVSAE